MQSSRLLRFLTWCFIVSTLGGVSFAAADFETQFPRAYELPIYSLVHKLLIQWPRLDAHCSVVFISADVALTAMHCLEYPGQRKIIFNFSWNELSPPVDLLSETHTAGYPGQLQLDDNVDSRDYAILKVAQDNYRQKIEPVELARAEEVIVGAAVMAVGYPSSSLGDVGRRLSLCKITGLRRDRILTNCSIRIGMSRGPLFVITAEGWKLAGITSYSTSYVSKEVRAFTNLSSHREKILQAKSTR